ncbi:MAG: cytochrome c oxidase subunit [Acidimicrobiia bacterium]|jgi:cytochrome c oxidase subunit 2|nr:cytochrome c oxidase subunit [Acidimicrobiia bacterium]
MVGACVVTAGCTKQTPNALDPKGSSASTLTTIWWLLFGAALVVFVVVTVLILWGAFRRPGGDLPGKMRPGTFIGVGGVAIPALILAGVGVLTVWGVNRLRSIDPGAMRIEVEGRQYWWVVRYPSEGVITANEIHVPAGRQIDLVLTSSDVVHSFWVPQLDGKTDHVPGQTNHMRMQADTPGVYLGQCAEFCGLSHAWMRLRVVVDEPAAFAAWADAERASANPATDAAAQRGREVLQSTACAGCHTVRGTDARGDLGPDLTHVGSRATIGAGVLPNNPQNVADFIRRPQDIKPGNVMPPVPLSDGQVNDLVAYLESLQ